MRMQSGACKPVRSGQGTPQELESSLNRKLWMAKFFENRPTHRIVELKMGPLPWPLAPSKALQALGQ
jgi:hypothetical protein